MVVIRPDRALLRQLEALYCATDKVVAAFSCPASGDCCHLATTGREPMLFPLELALILGALEDQGRPLPPPRPDGACAFLDPSRRCSVYAVRPFGCRTFFCDRRTGPRRFPEARLFDLTRRLTRLSDQQKEGVNPQAISRLLQA